MLGDVDRMKKWMNEPNEPHGTKEWTTFENFQMLKLK